ncbi:MAG: DUF1460 domain-containing protein [Bacteroidales bacterium]
MKTLIVMAVLLLSVSAGAAATPADTVYATEEDKAVFDRYLLYMEDNPSLPFDSLVLKTALFFLGTPYVGATLEKEPEGLAVNLRELDCATFVETVLALARMIAAGDATFDGFCNQLRFIRYREGAITSYIDRLHYTSDWYYENDRKRIIAYNMAEKGAKPYTFNLNYMSAHTGSYRQLQNNPALIPQIEEIERRISARTSYYYIPKYEIEAYADRIPSGDLVGFVTSVKGLDISHVGIILRTDGKLTFIHASSVAMKVIVNEEPLQEYVEKGKRCLGIMTAHPLPPLSR